VGRFGSCCRSPASIQEHHMQYARTLMFTFSDRNSPLTESLFSPRHFRPNAPSLIFKLTVFSSEYMPCTDSRLSFILSTTPAFSCALLIAFYSITFTSAAKRGAYQQVRLSPLLIVHRRQRLHTNNATPSTILQNPLSLYPHRPLYDSM